MGRTERTAELVVRETERGSAHRFLPRGKHVRILGRMPGACVLSLYFPVTCNPSRHAAWDPNKTPARHKKHVSHATLREKQTRPYPEYSRANSYPCSPSPPRRARPRPGPHSRQEPHVGRRPVRAGVRVHHATLWIPHGALRRSCAP